tara:strand:- start:6269 stop:6532 length:264 start_codon:yes stop_codon:yes gene_type:complete
MNHKAILALYSQVVTVSDDIALDVNGDQVTLNEALVNAWVDPDTYKYNRVAAYPSIGDQLDALYHAGVFPSEMTAIIKAVKDANPKP